MSQSLLNQHQLATRNNAHLCGLLESHYWLEQAKPIRELGGHLTNLPKMGAPETGMAESIFDKLVLGNGNKN
ncbi:hypothetical protein CB1_001020004 [Camelus ferus]|nr:hypothetical protein CB1_001020004 [Camelus ferus]